jgi:ubiquinol-cytochrome c reductase cytochrome b subunit
MGIGRRIHRWLELRYGIDEVVSRQLTGYLLPTNINVWYSLGSVLLFFFAFQVGTGMLLLVNYVPDAEKAFRSVSMIMNGIPLGWLVRYCHSVGSNMMVFVLFLHMLSVLFMGSYKSPRELNWVSGFLTFNLVLLLSLTGYLLPWSQLSYWATTVATNSGGAIPFVGDSLVRFLRGGQLVGPQTIGRFFALHVAIVPLLIGFLVVIHIFFLKRTGISAPPFGEYSRTTWTGDRYVHQDHPGGIPFFPNYFIHDLTTIALFCALYFGVVFFSPHFFFTPESFAPADPLRTPARIKPEWYFLANYQILKIFPSELTGIAVQVAAAVILGAMPFIDRSRERNPFRRRLFLTAFVSGLALWIALTIWGHYS